MELTERAYHDKEAGLTFSQIAERWNDQGVERPGGKLWNKQTVHRLYEKYKPKHQPAAKMNDQPANLPVDVDRIQIIVQEAEYHIDALRRLLRSIAPVALKSENDIVYNGVTYPRAIGDWKLQIKDGYLKAYKMIEGKPKYKHLGKKKTPEEIQQILAKI